MEKLPQTDVRHLLGQLPLFLEVDGDILDRLTATAREHALERGAILFHPGTPGSGFYVVAHGQIKLAVSAANGNEKIVEIISARMSFGEAVMFMGGAFPVRAEALTDSRVLFIPREPVLALLEHDKSFMRKMLAGLSRRLHSLVQDVESYALHSSTQRLIGFLLRDAENGEEAGAVEITLAISRQTLASRISITPETCSRILHNLAELGLIEVHGRTIRIPHVAALAHHGMA